MDTNNELPLIPTDCDSVVEGLQNFALVFESRYSNLGHVVPPFCTQPLNVAIEEAFNVPASERRPLALYIHNDKSVAAHLFAQNIICIDAVSQLLRHQYVIWPWDVTYKENEEKLFNFLMSLNMEDVREMMARFRTIDNEKYPLLILLTKDKNKWVEIGVCAGIMETVDTVMDKLMEGIEVNENIKTQELAEEEERRERERIRNEQAREYQMSLETDLAKREQKEKEIREQKEEEQRRIAEQEEAEIKKALMASQLPPEPEEKEKDIIVVRFRLPDGDMATRRFRKSDPLSVLYTFLASKGYNNNGFKFLNSDHPKKDISQLNPKSTFAELNFPAREQIFVEET
ncbi:hypothetical protein WR25_12936 [Diploscapter pachys]|uniref:UBX domain-containing protein n=1 Tax=Diploscapter pachys TaxID=2018661 RepID=A0A2A2LXQ2_9BILA|nr:hypothetical protein WR25_12936 [Diploscapter pachys]